MLPIVIPTSLKPPSVLARSPPFDRIPQDPWLQPPRTSGELTAEAVDGAQRILEAMPRDRKSIAEWFGCHITVPRGGPPAERLEEPVDWPEFVELIAETDSIVKFEATRCVWLADDSIYGAGEGKEDGGTLFVDGR